MLTSTTETETSEIKDKEVKTYAKNILKNMNICDKLRKALKLELKTSSNISNIRWKRRILTISKAFCDQFQNDLQHIDFIWGEISLLCLAILFNNSQQNSNWRYNHQVPSTNRLILNRHDQIVM
ncbi:unnamed protein product [Rhizophagus irregularis]|nr:unnamed protein product [Rhizophagus irregularis]